MYSTSRFNLDVEVIDMTIRLIKIFKTHESIVGIFLSGSIVVAFVFLSLQPFIVAGDSMTPTYSHDEFVIVEKLSHNFILRRGNVIVFENPHDSEHITIKRIVGLPNEEIIVANDGVHIVDKEGTEIIFESGTLIGGHNNGDFEIKLGPEDYFVLGDNRSKSTDSRAFGAVQSHNVIGKPILKMATFWNFVESNND